MATFLKSAVKEGGRELHVADLARYSRMLKDAEAFAQRRLSGAVQPDLGERIFFDVLGHARLLDQALLTAVVEYKYHLQALIALDFAAPLSFVRSAEKELGRLNPKKIPDAIRMKRLQEMIEDRKKILTEIKKRWMEPAAELRHVAMYVRDNLAGIERICETAAVILAELEIGRTKEHELVEGLKTYFKDRLKEALRRGQVGKEDLENAKNEAEMLSLELSILIREDLDSVTALFEAVLDHVKKIGLDLVFLLDELGSKKGGTLHAGTDILVRIEHTLVALINQYRFEQKKAMHRDDTSHEEILTAKRREMLDYVFEQVRKERRDPIDRRITPDRRKLNDTNYKGPERRNEQARRTEKIRRR